MNDTMQDLLESRAEHDGVAVLRRTAESSVRWTWRDYIARAKRHASAVLSDLDASRPMHVGALLGNTPEMLTAIAAAALGGYVLCGVNDTRRGTALLADLATADVQVLLVDAEHLALLDGLDLTGITVIDVDSADWTCRYDLPGEFVPHRRVAATDPFMVIFTSGTSGDPKAVLVSHHAAVFAGDNLIDRVGLFPSDVFYLSMPLFHSNGILAGYAPAVATGGTMVPAKFSASQFLHDIRCHGATYLNYVGKPLAYLLATPTRPDDTDNPLRIAFGNEASDRDIEEFAQRFDASVVDGFGSTENAVIVTRDEGTPSGSIGRGIPGVAVYRSDPVEECATAIFDASGRLMNPDDAIGELVNTTGAGFFLGYYNNEQANAERMRGGMYWSGDLAYKDADGWVYLAGRTADWIRVDGENLTAAPIERILQRCPQVSRVAVYGVGDPRVGDQVMAALVLRDGQTIRPEDLTSFLSGQKDLSPKAWPRFVRIATELPTTATNKVLKRTLISQATDVRSDILWERPEREYRYRVVTTSAAR